MNGNVLQALPTIPTENEQNSPSALYLDSVKGVLLLWHEEIMGGGGDIENLNSVLIDSAKEIASCLVSEQSRQELQYVHELVMKAINTDRLVPRVQPLSQKHEQQLRLLSKHFDERYEHIINSDLTDSSLQLLHQNGSLVDYDRNWNGDDLNHTRGELKYTQEQFEEKLSEYTQKLTLNLEKKYIQELEEMNKKHEATIRQIEKFYENKIADEKVNSSFSKIEYDEEMRAIIQDRDNLRQMTHNLRQVVTDLSNYVNNCETQLNKTLLNELLEDTSGIDDCSSFQQLKHVHFAPDISALVSGERLDYSDLRATLDTCLERLKQEASQLLSATQGRGKCHQGDIRELVARYEAEIERLKVDAITPEMMSLQHQIEAADAQLKSSRQFLEEQAAERETEREELLAQISQLKAQIRDQKHLAVEDNETKLLEDRLEDAHNQVKKLTAEKQSSDENLNEAKTKIWELREIVSSLEKELAQARENEAGLARKIAEFEQLFEKQYQTHHQLVQEFETLKMNSKTQGLEVEIPADPACLHQIKTQLLWLERSLQRRTKELETMYVFDANLSSPSEDISARDEMVNTPDSGRVDSPGLPLEQVTSLYDQFVRHSRAEDATVKCLKDTVLQLTAVREQLNEVQHERDALQTRYNKTLAELSQAKVQLEELRHSLFSRNNERVDEKSAEMDLLEEKVKTLAKALLIKEDEIKEKERELSKALFMKEDEIREKEKAIEAKDRMVWSLEQELSAKDVTDYRHRDASHVSHSELKLKRLDSPVVRFNDTLDETPGFSFDKNRMEHFDDQNTMLKDELLLEKESLADLNRILKEELAEKERIIVEIKADADSLKKVLDGLQETVREAKRHSENMSEQQGIVQVCKGENEKLRERCERYEKEVVQLKEELEDVKKELESVCNSKDEYKKEIETLCEDCERLKQELEDVKKKLKNANNKRDEHKKDAERLNEKVRDIQIQYSRCEADNAQLKNEIQTCEKDLCEFLEEFPVFNEIKKDRSNKHGIGNLIETLKEELALYVGKQEIYMREKGDVNDRDYKKEIAGLKSRETQLKKKVQAVEEKLSKCENEIDGLKQNEILLNNQLERVNMTCELYKSKAMDLEKKEDLIKKLKENIELSEENYVKLENEIGELRKREKEMANEICSREQAIEALKEKQTNEECEQCKEYMRDPTSRFSNPFPADQSATTSFDIKSLKDEMFSELAEKLRKELTLSAKLDEKLLNKQKDFAYEQQDHIIQTLNEDKRKLRDLILAERARFESEQLQDADLLERLRQKLESTKENSRKIIQGLEAEIQSVAQEKNNLLGKIKLVESSVETYKSDLEKSSRHLQTLEVQFSEQKSLLEVTQVQLKQKTNDYNHAQEKISAIENELSKAKEKLVANQNEGNNSDVQNIMKEQRNTLNTQSLKISELEKQLTEQKREHEAAIASKQQLEERIKTLNETLMLETKRVLKLEAELEVRKTEIGEQSETTRTLREQLREKELSLEIEKERSVTLREKLVEKSETLAREKDKVQRLEERVQSLHEEKDALISSRHSEVEHGKQMRQILARLMRAESCNKSLVFQKRYLKNMISSYVRMECRTVQMLEGKPHAPASAQRTFRVAVLTVISIFRMKYLRRKRSATVLRTLK